MGIFEYLWSIKAKQLAAVEKSFSVGKPVADLPSLTGTSDRSEHLRQNWFGKRVCFIETGPYLLGIFEYLWSIKAKQLAAVEKSLSVSKPVADLPSLTGTSDRSEHLRQNWVFDRVWKKSLFH